jgi:hypothetical protein
MSSRRDEIAALAHAFRRGDLSLDRAIEGFVRLFAVRTSKPIASVIARDEILRERFYRLFVELTPPS